MNRIYRRLWNRARQCWVVTSELGRATRKPAQQVCGAPAVVLLVLAASFSTSAYAQQDEMITSIGVIRCRCTLPRWPSGLPSVHWPDIRSSQS
ncbi:hypothetical protein H3005_15810 [Stenotrophomonas sp. Br8]|uniref:ESPR domain-containing protein n=1 Tax=Stenotrophomonas sp. Br8 TaxID=2759658 RepID=UPI00168AA61F|nr:ESPR domain-containing protein [Stenotrophomonas sp. Br8]MBD3683335.1 hypothetical protein [Stenotrophomonas sp. Br8]